MSVKYTEPRDFIQHINNSLVTQYLKQNYKKDFPVKENEDKEDLADRFIEFTHSLDERTRDQIYVELEYINELSSERHISAICNYHSDIDRQNDIEKFAKNNDERALVLYMKYKEQFDSYYARANIQSLKLKELQLPLNLPVDNFKDDHKVKELEQGIQKIYSTSLKGEKCKVKQFEDNKKIIVRAYIEDLPTRDTVFKGDKLDEKHVRKPVFDVIFVYTPALSLLGVKALGGREIVESLQRLFCKTMFDITTIDTNEVRYKIAETKDIINMKLVAKPEYGIERSYIKSIKLKKKGIPHKILIEVGGKENYQGTDGINAVLKELNLDLNDGWEPESIKIGIYFKKFGKGKRNQVTVAITPPNTCDLKNREQDDVVRKLLKDWGILLK